MAMAISSSVLSRAVATEPGLSPPKLLLLSSKQQCFDDGPIELPRRPDSRNEAVGLMAWRSSPTGLPVPDGEDGEAAELALELSSFGAWLLSAAPTRRSPPGPRP